MLITAQTDAKSSSHLSLRSGERSADRAKLVGGHGLQLFVHNSEDVPKPKFGQQKRAPEPRVRCPSSAGGGGPPRRNLLQERPSTERIGAMNSDDASAIRLTTANTDCKPGSELHGCRCCPSPGAASVCSADANSEHIVVSKLEWRECGNDSGRVLRGRCFAISRIGLIVEHFDCSVVGPQRGANIGIPSGGESIEKAGARND